MSSSFWENNVTNTNSAIPEYGILIFHKYWTGLFLCSFFQLKNCARSGAECFILTYLPKQELRRCIWGDKGRQAKRSPKNIRQFDD
jgi:hypothetical protein